jgi:hypothetical protein
MDFSAEIGALRREVAALEEKLAGQPLVNMAQGGLRGADAAPPSPRLADSAGGDAEPLAGLDAVLRKIDANPRSGLLAAFAVGLSIGLALASRNKAPAA